jgi:hypothetical protein
MTLERIGIGGLRKLIGKIQSSEHGHAEGVDCAALRGYSAHFCVHARSQLPDMIRVLAREVIGLVVDLNRDVFDCFAGLFLRHPVLHLIP